ncbi:MAG: hypothetical protein HY847_05710 [Betaproteobacteria bacterium]|nr:hypothetical protein [Betaproteobacteria bacterium]
MKNRYAMCLLAILLAGCGMTREIKVPAHHADRPQAYHDGYLDGCRMSQPSSSQAKDMERIKADSLYANGWYDGFGECKERVQPISRDSVKK